MMLNHPRLCLLFSGAVVILGAYLAGYETGTARWIGLALLGTALLSLALGLIELGRQRKKIYALHDQLIDFLEGRLLSPRFSVDDDDFALLENAVVELESRLLLEREKAQRESQKNADFIADISHQLKTPLAALKLYCEMGCRGNGGSVTDKKGAFPSDKFAARQLVLIERMEHLIQSLLRLEKLRADAYEMHFETHNLSDLILRVWEELKPLHPHKLFGLTGEASLRCDAYWISEALQNILKNSCEHTPPEGLIQALLETTDRSVIITIGDDGGGIPEKELPDLFRRFYRTSRLGPEERSGRGTPRPDSPSLKPEGGVGLGLAIARTIVEKHHGLIGAENTSSGLQIVLCFPRLDGILRG